MMTMRRQTPMNIHLAVDGSEHSLAAAQLLHDLPLPPGSEVTALGVLTSHHTPRQSFLLAALDEVQTILQGAQIEVKTGLLHGHPAEALLEFADQRQSDLIVAGAKGLRATLGILLGGVAQQIVEYAALPVLIVRAPYTELRRVLLVTDDSPHSQQAVSYLTQFPLPDEATVHVMHVLAPLPSPLPPIPARAFGPNMISSQSYLELEEDWSRYSEIEEGAGEALLTRTLQDLKASGIEATRVLIRGDAATEIIEYVKANAIDLVVAGSRGLSQVKGWLLGSVSRKLVHYAGCSVLIVRGIPDRHADFQAP
jgi:nucleotide-binding universal stress UspA family protein